MKLHELGAQRQTEKIANIIESRLGAAIDVTKLSPIQAQHMLRRVRSLVKEHRSTPRFHNSEKNPNYLTLVMMEQALSGMIGEQTPPAAGGAPGMANPAANTTGAANPAQAAAKMKIADKEKKDQLRELIKQKQAEITQLQRQLSAPPSPVTALEARLTKRLVREQSELQQAQVVLAAQDMVDQLQKMMEQISEMQFKDLPALTDSIKNEVGTEQATQFNADASAALSTLLGAVQAGKTQLETAQGVLTGQAPVVPGEDDLDAAAELGDEGEVDVDADLSLDANLPDDEEEPVDDGAALGRERR